MRPLMFCSTKTSTYSRFTSLTYSMSSYLLVRVAPAGGYEAYEVFLRGADLSGRFQLDACAIVVAVVIGAVVAAEVLVFLRVVVYLVDPVAVPVIGCGHLEGFPQKLDQKSHSLRGVP